MASDTEDQELESLRFAVLASLKAKPTQGASLKAIDPVGNPPSSDVGDDDDEEDLEALRLAALQSKKEGGSAHASLISTPVTGSPLHQPQLKSQSNLITIPLQDLSQTEQPEPNANVDANQQDNHEGNASVMKVEHSNKFSRFESSGSESDFDDDLLYSQESEKDTSGASASDDEVSSASTSSSSSDNESENASGSEDDGERKSSDSDNDNKEEVGNDGDGDDVRTDTKSHGNDGRGSIETQRNIVCDDTSTDRRQRRDREVMVERRRNEDRGRGDRAGDDRRRRDDRSRHDRVRKDDRRRGNDDVSQCRDYSSHRGERQRFPLPSSRRKYDRARENDRQNSRVDRRTLEARRQKFDSKNGLNIKDTTVSVKDVKTTENGMDFHVKERSSKTVIKTKDQVVDLDKQKSDKNEKSESDISLSDDEVEGKDSESDSESETEMSRFKHTSSQNDDVKTVEALPQSRLITSMILPKEGPPALLPRRRARDNENPRERWKLNEGDRSHGSVRDRAHEHKRDRRARLPRHLDQHERSSSRDRFRRDDRRRPGESRSVDRYKSKSIDHTSDQRAVENKADINRDFVSESSESEEDAASQGLRSIVKADRSQAEPGSEHKTSERRHKREDDGRDSDRRNKDDKRRREKKSSQRLDLKVRIDKRRKGEPEKDKGKPEDDVTTEVRRVDVDADDAAQKKRSVLERLGSAPSSSRSRGSVKSRLGPLMPDNMQSKDLDSVPIDMDAERLVHAKVGPEGDSIERRNVEISESHHDTSKNRGKLKRSLPDDSRVDDVEVSREDAELPVSQPPTKRKQLSKSLLSRLSERPGRSLEPDAYASHDHASPDREVESSEWRAGSRVDYAGSKEKERKSKRKDVWSSRARTAELDVRESDLRQSKDEALEAKIKKIKAQNAAILQRQREIEEEKKMFGGHR